MNDNTTSTTEKPRHFERLGKGLYWKGGKIVARVRVNGNPTWRSTGTSNPAEARAWLKKWKTEEWCAENGIEPKGVALHRQRVTVGELIDAYVTAGHPSKKSKAKSPVTTAHEIVCLRPVRAFFGTAAAAGVTLDDCDKYRDWRLSGGYLSSFKAAGGVPRRRKEGGGSRSVDLELTFLSNAFNLAVRRNTLKSNPLVVPLDWSIDSR